MRKRRIIVVLALATGLSGCYYDIEQELYPGSFCTTDNVTWSGTIEPLITSRCAIPGCHVSGAQAPDLSTYSGVSANADQIRQVTIVEQVMPPSSPLNACQMQQLSIWLDLGAPEN